MASSNVPPIPRPGDCPACRHCSAGSTEEKCGLLTFSASQLGAVAALVIGGAFYLWQLLARWHQTQNSLVSDTPSTAVMHMSEAFFSLEFWAVLFLTALYYAVGEWAAEEHDYHELRTIKWPWIEFWLRVGLAAAFGIAAAGTPEALSFGLTPRHSSFFVLTVIYFGFILWDLIVFEGGKDVSWRLIVGDVAGAGLVLLCLWTHYKSPLVALFAVLVSFGLSLQFLGRSLNKVNFWTRITDRRALR